MDIGSKMLELITLGIIVAVLPLLKTNLSMGGAFKMKESVFIIISIAYLCYAMVFRGVSNSPLLYLVCFITMSAMWSTNINQSWQEIAKWWALYGLFTLVSFLPMNTVLMMSMIPIPFILIWGFIQKFGFEPFDKLMKIITKDFYTSKSSRFNSSLGNSSYAAAFLAPYVFIAAYLGMNVSWLFFIFIPFILTGIIITECYAAILGVLLGVCVIFSHVFTPFALIIYIIICLRRWHRALYDKWVGSKENSLFSRIMFSKLAFNLWLKKPLFGWGIKTYQKEQFVMAAELNMNNSRFPLRVHNDYMEMLCECGIIGLSLMLYFIFSVIYPAIQSGNYILLGGVICLLVHGMFLYTLSIFSYVPYIVLASCLTSQTTEHMQLPLMIALICLVGFVKMIINYVIKLQISQYWTAKSESSTNIGDKCKYAEKALKVTPFEGTVLKNITNIKGIMDASLAIPYLEKSLHFFDGTMNLAETWLTYGNTQRLIGDYEGAKKSLNYALYLNSDLSQANFILSVINKAEQNFNGGVKITLPPNMNK